jgi:spore germination protein GerM
MAAVLAALFGLAACGVPLDDSPRAISRTTVPADETVTTTPTTSDNPRAATVSIYFLRGNSLELADYPVEGQPTLGKALDLQLGGPQADDADLSSAIPPETRLLDVVVTDGVAMVDLTSEMGDISGQPGKQAFAQIVFTVLGFPEIHSVRFRVAGQPIVAPTDRGNLDSVSAGDYDPPLNPR